MKQKQRIPYQVELWFDPSEGYGHPFGPSYYRYVEYVDYEADQWGEGGDWSEPFPNTKGDTLVYGLLEAWSQTDFHPVKSLMESLNADPIRVRIKPDYPEIDATEIKIETYRGGVSGMSNVYANEKTYAVKLTHIPTGLSAECQEHRSQLKNSAQALVELRKLVYHSRNDARS